LSELGFGDVLLAKIMAEEELIEVRILKRLLLKINSEGGSFSNILSMGQFTSAESLQTAEKKRSKYQLMMLESTIADLVKETGALPQAHLKKLQRRQRAEGFEESLATMIARHNLMPRELVEQCVQKGLKRLKRHQTNILAHYLETNFEGLDRALSKSRKVKGHDRRNANNVKTPSGRYPGVPRSSDLGTLSGRFALQEAIGRGSMGVVYRAQDLESGKAIAVKVSLTQDDGDDHAQRFQREIRVSRNLVHPNIVRNITSGETPEGYPYLAMEYVDGELLADLMVREGPFPTRRFMKMVIQIARGLQAIHEFGLIHRDLKPENILVYREGSKEIVKIMDFGLARPSDPEQFKNFTKNRADIFVTMIGHITGTPAFLAPESIRGLKVTHSVDLYALGVSMFEMITGELPFDKDSTNAMLSGHLFEEPRSLESARPDLAPFPEGMEQLISKLLEKLPEDRPKNAFEVLQSLLIM
jgi:hypothetical protein